MKKFHILNGIKFSHKVIEITNQKTYKHYSIIKYICEKDIEYIAKFSFLYKIIVDERKKEIALR